MGALWLLAALAYAGPRVNGKVEGGGGYQGNVNASAGEALGAPSLAASARVGLAGYAQRIGLATSVRYSGNLLPTLPELSSHGVAADVGVDVPISWRVSLQFIPTAFSAWYSETARSHVGGGGAVSLDYRAHPRVTANLLLGGRATVAREPAFSSTDGLLDLGVSWKPAQRTWIEPLLSGQVGRVVRYETVVTTTTALARGPGQGTGNNGDGGDSKRERPTSVVETFGTSQVATSVPARSLTAALDLEQGLGRLPFVRGWVSGTLVDAEPEGYLTWSVGLRLGVRLL